MAGTLVNPQNECASDARDGTKDPDRVTWWIAHSQLGWVQVLAEAEPDGSPSRIRECEPWTLLALNQQSTATCDWPNLLRTRGPGHVRDRPILHGGRGRAGRPLVPVPSFTVGVADREEWGRTIRLLLCSMLEIGCDRAFFDAVLAAQVERGDGAAVAVTEVRCIGAERGFDWLDEACRVCPAGDATDRIAA